MKRMILGWLVFLALLGAALADAGVKTSNQFFYKPDLGARGTAEKTQFDAGLDLVDAHLGKYKTLGDPGYETLAAALSTIGSNPVSLVIPAGTVNITANTTIPANVHLVVQRGGIFNIANGVTLTINGGLSAGHYQIFAWSGTGTLAGSPRLDHALPEWFGALGDGVTNDFAALDKCLAVAQTWLKPVKFRQATYKINTKLTPIDVSKTSLVGEGTILDFSGLPASGVDHFAIQLFSSADYVNFPKNRKTALQGFFIVGSYSAGNIKAHTGLCIGHVTYTGNSLFNIRNCAIQGFQYNLRLIQNAWLLTFYDCEIRWGGMYVAPSLSNMGSSLGFVNCTFADAAGHSVSLGTGNYYFYKCAFDNNYPEITGDVSAVFRDTHFEASGSSASSGYWLNLNSVNGYVLLDGCQIFGVTSAASYNNALFRVHNSNLFRGLHIRNLWINNLWSNYTAEVNSGHRLLVEGLGRVTVENVNTWWTGGLPFAIAQYPSRLSNRGFETGNTTGWTTSGTGTVSASTAQKKTGTYSLRLEAAAGKWCAASQQFAVEPGQHVTVSLWEHRTITTGSTSTSLTFYNEKGDNVTVDDVHGDQSGWTQRTNTDATWHVLTLGAFVPKGAVKAKFEVYADSSSGTTTVYIDDVIVNVY